MRGHGVKCQHFLSSLVPVLSYVAYYGIVCFGHCNGSINSFTVQLMIRYKPFQLVVKQAGTSYRLITKKYYFAEHNFVYSTGSRSDLLSKENRVRMLTLEFGV